MTGRGVNYRLYTKRRRVKGDERVHGDSYPAMKVLAEAEGNLLGVFRAESCGYGFDQPEKRVLDLVWLTKEEH